MYKWYNDYITLVHLRLYNTSFIMMSHGTVRIFVQYTYIHANVYISINIL